MPRQKKTRKIGQIGTPKSVDNSARAKTKEKIKKGNPSGSRHNVEVKKNRLAATKKQINDPRHGSKKPIVLTPEVKRYTTPAEELAAIESDDRLATLLDKIERDEPLKKAQQTYVDEKIARHKVLCDILGLSDSEADERQQIDPLENLDAISMQEFVDTDDQ